MALKLWWWQAGMFLGGAWQAKNVNRNERRKALVK